MEQRGISEEDIRRVLYAGEVLAEYPQDMPRPSYLLLGWSEATPLHVVAADDEVGAEIIVITAYVPDPALRENDFKRRKP